MECAADLPGFVRKPLFNRRRRRAEFTRTRPSRERRAAGISHALRQPDAWEGRDLSNQRSRRGNAYSVTFVLKGFPPHLRVGLHHLPDGQALTLTFPHAQATPIVRDRRDAHGDRSAWRNDALFIQLTTMYGTSARGEVLVICAAEPCGLSCVIPERSERSERSRRTA